MIVAKSKATEAFRPLTGTLLSKLSYQKDNKVYEDVPSPHGDSLI